MSALSASSKLSGCNDTGLAFGIVPPQKASGIARLCLTVFSRPCLSAESAARESSSASCYDVGQALGGESLYVLSKREDPRLTRKRRWHL